MSENPETAVAEQEVADSEAADTPMVEGDGAVEVEAVAEEVVADEANEPDTAKTDTVAGEDVIVEATETEVAGAAAELEAVADEASETDTVAGDDVIAEATETDVAGAAAELVVDEADAEVVESEAAESETGDIPTQSDSADSEADKSESGRVVRVLSVGMEVTGTVKRTTDFGAFVDIGVGRDGLIHISELSTRRVAKVTDVLKQGQEVTAWIKELDRSRNRISLTLIPPGTKTIRDLQKDEIVTGTVTRIVPYGAFVDIGVGRDALLHIREMSDGYVNKPEDVVQEGETVEARIIEISRRRGRIDLSMKGLGPEPEAEAAPDEAPEDEGEPEDPFENMEVLSPMELAFQKAMNEGDEEVEGVTRRRSKRARREQMRSLQDEIISRTLKSGGPR